MLDILFYFYIIVSSTIIYLYLHFKTHIRWLFIYVDNVIVILITSIIYHFFKFSNILAIFILPPITLLLAFTIAMIRFWRTPNRKLPKGENIIVSPADGNVIYIKKIEAYTTPISVKNGTISSLDEITKTNLLDTPCWLVGINMTPFDVHKNCAPIDGKITLQKHTFGKFLSLKEWLSETENERNTFVIENDKLKIGVVQIASKKVRRIDAYAKEGDIVKQGQWIGMIKLGSQVDVILPINCKIKVKIGEQIFAKKSVLANF